MNAIYIIKNNKIYEVCGEDKAIRIEIINGVPKKGKETVDYDAKSDFLYAFFEIRAKFSHLFENNEDFEEEEIEKEIEKPSKSKSKNQEENNEFSEQE